MKNTFSIPNLDSLLNLTNCLSDEIVIISTVGKSILNSNGLKAKSLSREFNFKSKSSECEIEGIYDEDNRIIYLHLKSYLDTDILLEKYEELTKKCEQERNCTDFLAINDEIKSHFAKAFLLLMHLSHIVVLSHPTTTFDTNYIQYFKATDMLSNKLFDKIYEELKSIPDLDEEWVKNGRLCTPRLIFYFEKCPRNVDNIKKMEHNMEDKIYQILKKTRIISTSGGSLFAIPLNEEFVYISNENPCDKLGDTVRGLIKDCQPGGAMQIEIPFSSKSNADRNFKSFIKVHIQQAKNKCFEDVISSGRHHPPQSGHFLLPILKHWISATIALHDVIFKTKYVSSLCTDTRFSDQRCRKVLPLALARYQEGLPSHYAQSEHQARLNLVLALFRAQARGPVYRKFEAQLEIECQSIWENGRQQCEAASMTGNPCKLPKHSIEQDHISGVVYKSVCDCGRKIGPREDPYTAKQANYIFYQQMKKECQCGKLEQIVFPVFQPSINEFKAATLNEMEDQPSSLLSYRSGGELTPETEQRGLIRQPSTTEYLPGMLTLSSPPGLLPDYCSWSLVCLGASSLYSHNLGLSESHQPGFLSATNYLLPWDVTVSKPKNNWPHINKFTSRGRRGRPMGSQPTVKVFIGVEYECTSGHRFMLAAPDKVLKALPGSIVKDTGHTVADSDMPLYYPCACRAGKFAQLMRLHVVTPKAPVHCTLDPKIQPAAGAPIFVPTLEGPIKLSQSAYWVMRLPFIYIADKEHYPQHLSGRMLQGVFGVVEIE